MNVNLFPQKSPFRLGVIVILIIGLVGIIPAMTQEDHKPTIAEYLIDANDQGDFSLLLDAAVSANLVDVLSNPDANLTLFAPTDAAFEQLISELGITEQELLDRDDLADILLYHVIATDLTVDDLREALGFSLRLYVETLNRASCTLQVIDEDVLVNNARLVMSDIETANGIIHVIDRVLIPADEAEFIFSPTNEISGTMTITIGGQDLVIIVDEAYINAANAVEAAISSMDGLNFSEGGVSGVLQIGIPGGITFSVSFGEEGLSITSLPTPSEFQTETDASLSGILSFDVNDSHMPVRIVTAGVDLPELLALLPAVGNEDFEIDDISGDFEMRLGETSSMTITLEDGAVSINPAGE